MKPGNTHLKSNKRTDPSAPQDANMFTPCEKLISYTSLSCAISCVLGLEAYVIQNTNGNTLNKKKLKKPKKKKLTSISQIVQVVSILAVPIILVSVQFQSKAVSGAQNSEFLF